MLQRALDEEVAAFLSRARYFAHADGDRFAYREAAETDPDCRSEISVAMPQVTAAYWAALEKPPTPPMQNDDYTVSSPNWSVVSRVPRLAWRRTWQNSASISTTSHPFASGSGPPICWSVHWRK